MLILYFIIEVGDVLFGPLLNWVYVRDEKVFSTYTLDKPLWITSNFNPISVQMRMKGVKLDSAEQGGASQSLNAATITIPSVDSLLSSS